MIDELIYVTVLFMRQPNGIWVAQGLEYDLVAQGSTQEIAKRAFERTFLARVELDKQRGRVPLSSVGKAPREYWIMFANLEQRTFNTERIGDTPDETPPAFMVQAFPQESSNHLDW